MNRKNRVGQLVRFSGFSEKVDEAKKAADGSRQPIYSESFKLMLPTASRNESQMHDGYDW